MAEYDELVKSGKLANELPSESTVKDLEQMATGVTDDKPFQKFKKRVEVDPEQVICRMLLESCQCTGVTEAAKLSQCMFLFLYFYIVGATL